MLDGTPTVDRFAVTRKIDGLNVGYTIDFRSASMERQAVTAWGVTEPRDDDSLVTAARGGDRSAFGRLYDRYARMVHGILLSWAPRSEVDDLAQDVFVLALR